MILDGDVRDLLAEVANDPRSTLFGVTPAEVVTSARLDVPTISAGTAGWTIAERHLLKGYREAVAEVLAPVLFDYLVGDGSSSEYLNGPKPVGPEHSRRARALGRTDRVKALDPLVTDMLDAIGKGGAAPGPIAIARVIRRLRPDHRSVLLEGLALIEEQPREAARLLRELYQDTNRSYYRYFAAVNLGLAISKICPLRATLEPFAAAVKESPSLAALSSLVVNACMVGESDTMTISAAYLESTISYRSDEFKQLCTIYQNRDWTVDARIVLKVLRDESGPVVGRLLDAILDEYAHPWQQPKWVLGDLPGMAPTGAATA